MAGFNQYPYNFSGYNNGMNQGFPVNNLNSYGNQQNFGNSVNNGITWVQGIEGAKAYQLNPNSNVILLDSESDRFYIKTSDNIGMCNLRVFNFQEVTNNPVSEAQKQEVDLSNYVTKEELQEALKTVRGGKQNGKQFVQSNEQAK
jgi:hypothetical protein